MGAKRFELSETIDAPVETVFLRATDVRAWPGYGGGITGVELVTGPGFGVGTRFRETRVVMGRETTEEMEVTAVEHGRGYSVRCVSCGCVHETTMRFHPVTRGTRVEAVTESTPESLFARLSAPLTGPMMKKMMLRCIGDDLAGLKAACEGGAAPGGAHGTKVAPA